MCANTIHTTHTNITASHRDAFKALTSGDYANFALFSCFVDGEPAAAIVSVSANGEVYDIHPLFVSVTEKMKLTDHEGVPPLPLMEPTGSTEPCADQNHANSTTPFVTE